jgi:hypothetical protein
VIGVYEGATINFLLDEFLTANHHSRKTAPAMQREIRLGAGLYSSLSRRMIREANLPQSPPL